jgi:hypothetical protein
MFYAGLCIYIRSCLVLSLDRLKVKSTEMDRYFKRQCGMKLAWDSLGFSHFSSANRLFREKPNEHRQNNSKNLLFRSTEMVIHIQSIIIMA